MEGKRVGIQPVILHAPSVMLVLGLVLKSLALRPVSACINHYVLTHAYDSNSLVDLEDNRQLEKLLIHYLDTIICVI